MSLKHITPKFLLRLAVLCFLTASVLPSVTRAQVPVFKISTEDSKITFYVKASVALEGTFEKWDSTLTFTSTDVSTGVFSESASMAQRASSYVFIVGSSSVRASLKRT